MKPTILHVPMTLALLAMPLAALADTPAMSGDHMAAAPSTMATMACRPATAKDAAASADVMAKAHVMIATMGTEKLVCMKLNHDKMAAEAAKAQKMATAAEASKAWWDFLQGAMVIPTAGTGGG